MIYEKLSDPGKALLYYKKASDYFQEEGDMRNMALVSMNMGNCYSAMKQYDDAIGYHNKALHVFREIKDSLQIAGEFVNLGTIYSNLKQYRKALEYLQQAKEYSRNNHVSLLSVTLKTFGICVHGIEPYRTVEGESDGEPESVQKYRQEVG